MDGTRVVAFSDWSVPSPTFVQRVYVISDAISWIFLFALIAHSAERGNGYYDALVRGTIAKLFKNAGSKTVKLHNAIS